MRKSSTFALALVTSTILAGCDRCSKDKAAEPATTSSSPTTQPEAGASLNQDPGTTTAPAGDPAATGGGMGTTDTAAPADGTTGSAPAGSDPAAAPAGTTAPAEATGTLQVTDVKTGTGVEATDGKKVTVHYVGTLVDGTKFDSSRDRGSPFPFVLGSGMVIAGWEQGVKGMKEGGVRKLVIPPNLAYGNRSVGGVIPPNSTLVFEIELLKVE